MADVTIKYKNSTIAELSATGTKTLKTSEKYCEGDISVNYVKPEAEKTDVNSKIYDITLEKKSGWVHLLAITDNEVLSNKDKSTFTVTLVNTSDYEYVNYSGSFFFATNTPFAKTNTYDIYGFANRQVNETTTTSTGVFYPANHSTTENSLGGFGIFRWDTYNFYVMPGDGFIRAGNYKLIFTW